jgi:hypothetical protein
MISITLFSMLFVQVLNDLLPDAQKAQPIPLKKEDEGGCKKNYETLSP